MGNQTLLILKKIFSMSVVDAIEKQILYLLGSAFEAMKATSTT